MAIDNEHITKLSELKSFIEGLWTKCKNAFVAKVDGKGLSTEDYTTAEKTKLSGIEAGAEANNIFVATYSGSHNSSSNTPYDGLVAAHGAGKRLVCWNSNARRLYTLNGYSYSDKVFTFTSCGGDGESMLDITFTYTAGNYGNVDCLAHNYNLAKKSHESTGTEYGIGTSAKYGHLKLSDSVSSSSDTNGGTAATPKAVKDAIASARTNLPIYDCGTGSTSTSDFDEALAARNDGKLLILAYNGSVYTCTGTSNSTLRFRKVNNSNDSIEVSTVTWVRGNAPSVSGSSVTASLSGHTHSASDITSGGFGTDRIRDDAITAAKVKDNETLPVNISGKASSADYLRYQNANEINFKNVPSGASNHWFNYKNGDTNSADSTNTVTKYIFGNRNNAVDGVVLCTNQFWIGSGKPSDDANTDHVDVKYRSDSIGKRVTIEKDGDTRFGVFSSFTDDSLTNRGVQLDVGNANTSDYPGVWAYTGKGRSTSSGWLAYKDDDDICSLGGSSDEVVRLGKYKFDMSGSITTGSTSNTIFFL